MSIVLIIEGDVNNRNCSKAAIQFLKSWDTIWNQGKTSLKVVETYFWGSHSTIFKQHSYGPHFRPIFFTFWTSCVTINSLFQWIYELSAVSNPYVKFINHLTRFKCFSAFIYWKKTLKKHNLGYFLGSIRVVLKNRWVGPPEICFHHLKWCFSLVSDSIPSFKKLDGIVMV